MSNRKGAGRQLVFHCGEHLSALAEAHVGLSETDSARFNARLVLMLACEIGDAQVLSRAIACARAGLGTLPAREAAE